MNQSHGRRMWSQVHQGSVTFFVVLGILALVFLPLTLLILALVLLVIVPAFLFGFFRAYSYGHS
jgi:hypothetical protein